MLVLRPVDFRDTAPHYLATWQRAAASAAGSSTGRWRVHRVPKHLRATPWSQLLPSAGVKAADELGGTLVTLSRSRLLSPGLSRFEDAAFIHVFAPPPTAAPAAAGSGLASAVSAAQLGSGGSVASGLVFSLPRYGLSFELRPDGQVYSHDFRGYHLRRRQLLVSEASAAGGGGEVAGRVEWTLPGLEQCLVLERVPGQEQVRA